MRKLKKDWIGLCLMFVYWAMIVVLAFYAETGKHYFKLGVWVFVGVILTYTKFLNDRSRKNLNKTIDKYNKYYER